jgi:P27 family predicted phage terminase small subunit
MPGGRPSKSLEVKIAQGDRRQRGKKKLQEQLASQPKGDRGLPECPKRLTGVAREMWNRCAAELKALDIDYATDAVMLEGACVAYAMARLADATLAKEGLFIQIGRRTKVHPANSVSQANWKLVEAFGVEFGFTPASFSRLKADSTHQPATAAAELRAQLPRSVN